MNSGDRILITGGAGYIGSILADSLYQRGYKITILDQRPPAYLPVSLNNNTNNFTFLSGDIRDTEIVHKSLRDVETVIYLAGVSDGRAGRMAPQHTYDVNVEGFREFVRLSAEGTCKKIIFASTFGVYGNDYRHRLSEQLSPNPAELYSQSKWQAEKILNTYKSGFVSVVILRLAMAFGYSPRMKKEFIVNRFILDSLQKKSISVWGGAQRRPQIHVKDIAAVVMELLTNTKGLLPFEVFNVGWSSPSLDEIANMINESLGGGINIYHRAPRENENSFVLDTGRWRRKMKTVPAIDIGYAVAEMTVEYSGKMVSTGNTLERVEGLL